MLIRMYRSDDDQTVTSEIEKRRPSKKKTL